MIQSCKFSHFSLSAMFSSPCHTSLAAVSLSLCTRLLRQTSWWRKKTTNGNKVEEKRRKMSITAAVIGGLSGLTIRLFSTKFQKQRYLFRKFSFSFPSLSIILRDSPSLHLIFHSHIFLFLLLNIFLFPIRTMAARPSCGRWIIYRL